MTETENGRKKKEAMPDEAEYEEDYVFGYFLNH